MRIKLEKRFEKKLLDKSQIDKSMLVSIYEQFTKQKVITPAGLLTDKDSAFQDKIAEIEAFFLGLGIQNIGTKRSRFIVYFTDDLELSKQETNNYVSTHFTPIANVLRYYAAVIDLDAIYNGKHWSRSSVYHYDKHALVMEPTICLPLAEEFRKGVPVEEFYKDNDKEIRKYRKELKQSIRETFQGIRKEDKLQLIDIIVKEGKETQEFMTQKLG